ncbi:Olfactory Receptor 6V1 [Manis pentadactyla]|nr:Olfactory Receptor 6V1 [Manis pentadactyla]
MCTRGLCQRGLSRILGTTRVRISKDKAQEIGIKKQILKEKCQIQLCKSYEKSNNSPFTFIPLPIEAIGTEDYSYQWEQIHSKIVVKIRINVCNAISRRYGGTHPWIMANLSHPLEVVPWGFSPFGELQVWMYGPFLMLRLLAFTGNTIIIVTVMADTHLHTPMYFFLGNFALLEILVTMTAVPRILPDLLPSLAAWPILLVLFLGFRLLPCPVRHGA